MIGATTNSARYAYIATNMLLNHGHEVELLGIKKGEVASILIQNGFPKLENIDTVTMYIGPQHQPAYYDYILELNPKRIVFNPGTENPEFETLAQSKGIAVEEACTLVLLSTGQY
ncbi:CoA-binding protein [Flectobacillus sp. BAB-3569]|uniref:CoA-binding protein n=1 Tax=Flectobacillus sp. BAB-3569 TaxID=1509483 RepID=UPI00286DE88B|nr:CoA-binding protein [Flectobacillus sp. BAB-3569]